MAKILFAALGMALLAGCASSTQYNSDYKNSNASMESAQINDSMGNDFTRQNNDEGGIPF